MCEKGDVLAQKAIANWSLSDLYTGDVRDQQLNRIYYALLQAVKSVNVAIGVYDLNKSHEKSSDIIRLIKDKDQREFMFELREMRVGNEYDCIPVKYDFYYQTLMSRAEGLYGEYKDRFRKCA